MACSPQAISPSSSLVLALLHVAVEVGYAAALLGAAVDRVQPPVGELQLLALAAALEPVHEHADSVNGWRVSIAPCSQPICVRPAVFATRIVCSTSRSTTTCWCEARKSRLDCAICSRSRIAASRATSRSPAASSSPSTSTVAGARRRAWSALVGLNRAHSSRSDLLAVEQLGRHPLGLQLRAERVDVRELLAHRPAVRLHRAAPADAVGSLLRFAHASAARATLWRGTHGTTT